MDRRITSIVSVLVVGLFFVAIFAPINFVGRVVAPGGQQHNIWGSNARSWDVSGIGEITVNQGTITAWIDGVSYGTNVTLSTGQFDLYVDGDTWGVPADDAFKDGGYVGDEIYYFLDYDPMDYYLNISTWTSYFNFSVYENVDPFDFDTQTYTDSGVGGNTYLRGLKINEVVLFPPSGNQYVILYDPMGDLNEAMLEDANMGYYLQKDDDAGHDPSGPVFDFNTNDAFVEAIGTDYYYINLTGFILDTEDELKLVWKNPANWGGTPTGDGIANDTDVIVDRVEWGNHINYIDSSGMPLIRDYDNTSMGNAIGSLSSNECYRRNGNGTDTDDCSADFTIQTATPIPLEEPAPPVGGFPGAPFDLRVHKGGGAWGGTSNDLVLNWTAHDWNYTHLEFNIVYYDTDLSDGFQYTSYVMFAPNNTGGLTEDGCVLPGWLADGNNYAFVVHSTNVTVGTYENMTGTNVGYKSIMWLQLNPFPLTNLLFVSIPYYTDWTMATDIAGPTGDFPDNSKIDTLSKWNYTKQTYDSVSWNPLGGVWDTSTDFPINQGDSLALTVATAAPYQWNIVGAYDDSFAFDLIKNLAPQTNLKFLSLPYHKSYVMASDITGPGMEFTDNTVIDTIQQWNYTIQTYDSQAWNPLVPEWEPLEDFVIFLSPGDHLSFTITKDTTPYVWQPQVIGL